MFYVQDDFLLRHYDSGECQGKLGHSRLSVILHRAQVGRTQVQISSEQFPICRSSGFLPASQFSCWWLLPSSSWPLLVSYAASAGDTITKTRQLTSRCAWDVKDLSDKDADAFENLLHSWLRAILRNPLTETLHLNIYNTERRRLQKWIRVRFL